MSENRDMSNFLPAKRGFKMACLYINSLIKHVGELRVLFLLSSRLIAELSRARFGRRTKQRCSRRAKRR